MKPAFFLLLGTAQALAVGCASANREHQPPVFYVEAAEDRVIHVFASGVPACAGFTIVNRLQLLQDDAVVGSTPLGPYAAAATITRGDRVFLRVSALLPSLQAFHLAPISPSGSTPAAAASPSLQPGSYRVRAVCGSVPSAPTGPIRFDQ